MEQIRILVADDSLTVRKRLIEVLSGEEDLLVVGEATNGREAIDLCERLRPNIITMDMMMPVMNGVDATEYIMAYRPTPILIVSVTDDHGQVLKTFDALAAGAVDVLEKPADAEPKGRWEREFLSAVRLVSRITPMVHPRGRLPYRGMVNSSAPSGREVGGFAPDLKPDRPAIEVVAIGASAGGPSALATVLSQLPGDFPLPILLVMHIAPEFADGLIEWLGKQSNIPVRRAIDGEPLPRSGRAEVLMAPPDRHLVVSDGCLRVIDTSERYSCRPSIDVLFESVAAECGPRSVACLLTGMGKDGATGLLAVRNSGGQTIAQDEHSSAVFGMPREAIELGAAQLVAPLGSIAQTLCIMAGVKI